MKFENSKFFELKHYKLELPFGNFYFLETFIISEINEGIHLDWNMIQDVMLYVLKFYGPDTKLGYISNRINSYSLNPQIWDNVYKKYDVLISGAIVAYNKMIYLNATLEKKMTKSKIKRCFSLEEAIKFILNFEEIKN